MKCCICGQEIKDWGNNPAGAMWKDPETMEVIEFTPGPDDRCCDECNMKYVIPGRIYRSSHPGMK